MKTRPNENADQVVNDVTVGSVVNRIAALATVSFRVVKADGSSKVPFFSG